MDRSALPSKFVEDYADFLLGTKRLYVRRTSFDDSDAAKELLNEVLIEALKYIERFESLMNWHSARSLNRANVESKQRDRTFFQNQAF
jgi:hypothetical protein